ncbi:hypothetical protein FKM82_003511 [Ascaphus truei]
MCTQVKPINHGRTAECVIMSEWLGLSARYIGTLPHSEAPKKCNCSTMWDYVRLHNSLRYMLLRLTIRPKSRTNSTEYLMHIFTKLKKPG